MPLSIKIDLRTQGPGISSTLSLKWKEVSWSLKIRKTLIQRVNRENRQKQILRYLDDVIMIWSRQEEILSR